jgi:hypothetical protein
MLPSTFLLVQLTGDWSSDTMTTVTNRRKVLSAEEKVKSIREIENGGEKKKKTDVSRDNGFVNSTIQKIWKNGPKLLLHLNRMDRE